MFLQTDGTRECYYRKAICNYDEFPPHCDLALGWWQTFCINFVEPTGEYDCP